MRVSGDRVVQAAGDAELLEAVAVGVGGGLIGVLGEHYGADEEAAGTEHVDESQYVFVIRDAEIAAGLAFFDMVGVDGDDDFHIVHQTFQHAELGVRLKAGQHARGVVVVEELASEFQIEFAAELRDALSDVGGLQLDVFFVVESLAHRGRHPFPNDVVNGKIIPDVVGNKKWDSPMGNPIRHREQLLPRNVEQGFAWLPKTRWSKRCRRRVRSKSMHGWLCGDFPDRSLLGEIFLFPGLLSGVSVFCHVGVVVINFELAVGMENKRHRSPSLFGLKRGPLRFNELVDSHKVFHQGCPRNAFLVKAFNEVVFSAASNVILNRERTLGVLGVKHDLAPVFGEGFLKNWSYPL